MAAIVALAVSVAKECSSGGRAISSEGMLEAILKLRDQYSKLA